MPKHTSPAGRAFIKDFEKCRLTAYLDGKGKNAVWTLGWGHTGPEVVEGTVWTQEKADSTFEHDLMCFESHVIALVDVDLTQNQFDALTSLMFNIGYKAFRTSTLLRYLNNKDYAFAKGQFKRWNKDNGIALAGLTRRRRGEATMFGTPDEPPIEVMIVKQPEPAPNPAPEATPWTPSPPSPSESPNPLPTSSTTPPFWQRLFSSIRSGFSTWRR